MNMRGESERHFEPISYLIEAHFALKVGLWKLAKVLRFMFGRAETACEAIYYCRHPTGCLPAGEKGSNLSDEENGGLRRMQKGLQKRHVFARMKKCFLTSWQTLT